jgi:elongation factor G
VRSIVVLGPTGAGKSALVERLAGPRTGRAGSLGAAWAGDIVFLDPPGHPDLGVWVTAGLRAADAALFVVPSGVGLSPMTVELWRRCADLGLPRLVAVSHLDAETADLDETVALCDRLFGDEVVPTHLPLYAGEPGRPGPPVGVLDLLGATLRDHSGAAPEVRAADAEHLELIEGARADLLEAVTTASADESLVDRYLDDELGEAEARAAFVAAVAAGAVHAVVPVVPTTGVGCVELAELLAALSAALPVAAAPDARVDGELVAPLAAEPDAPFVGELLARCGDGASLVRVLSGTLRTGEVATPLEPTPLAVRLDAPAAPGAVVVVDGLSDVRVGETVSAPSRRVMLRPWPRPGAAYPMGVVVDRADFADAWAFAGDDASLELRADGRLWTVGPEHARVTRARLARQTPGFRVDEREHPGDAALVVTAPPGAVGAVTRVLSATAVRPVSSERSADGATVIRLTVSGDRLLQLVTALRSAADGTVSVRRGGAPRPPDDQSAASSSN